MEITFYGVRGTVAVPGPDTNEFGGNTPCVHVRTKKGYDLILDAGTGICGLARKLMGTPLGKGQGETSILLSHTHLDHIQGFPFFIPAFIPGNKIRVYGGKSSSENLQQILEGQLHSTFSPICSMSNFSADIQIEELSAAHLNIDGVSITHCQLPHRGINSTAYRIEEEGKSLVYMTDVEYSNGSFIEDVMPFVNEAQILIHEAHFDEEDRSMAAGSGHSSIKNAVDLARKAHVKKLALFHYSPEYNDDKIREMAHKYNNVSDLMIVPSQEGLKLVL